MHNARFYVPILVALMAAGCAHQQQAYIIDPATGRPVPVVIQQQSAPPQYAQAGYQSPPQAAASSDRGLFTSQQDGPPAYLMQPAQPSYAVQYPAPQYAAPRTGGPYVPAPKSFAAASLY
jgi:hypothetical protein